MNENIKQDHCINCKMPFFHCECGLNGKQFISSNPLSAIEEVNAEIGSIAVSQLSEMLSMVGIEKIEVTKEKFMIIWDSCPFLNTDALDQFAFSMIDALNKVKNA